MGYRLGFRVTDDKGTVLIIGGDIVNEFEIDKVILVKECTPLVCDII